MTGEAAVPEGWGRFWAWGAIILVAVVIASLVYSYFGRRSVLVEAQTGTLTVELKDTMAPKYLGKIQVCQPSLDADDENNAVLANCALSMNMLSTLDREEIALPAGTRFALRIAGDRFEMKMLALPDGWDAAANGFGDEAVLSIPAARLKDMGQMSLKADLQLGTLPSTREETPLLSGAYEVRGYSFFGLLPFVGERKVLRYGSLPRGAYVGFEHALGHHPVAANIQITPGIDPVHSLSVLAVADYAATDLTLEFFLSDRIRIRPTLTDLILHDAVLQVMALIAAVFGVANGAMRRVARRNRPK